MEQGKYIVIEGHDGTGKSTQVSLVRKKLAAEGIDSIEFHEPGGSEFADEVRKVILNGDLPRDPLANLLLFTASRHDLWFSKALPALRAGKWVIASRNYISTLAYQGYGQGLDRELIINTTRVFTDDRYMQPDLELLLELDDPDERARRINKRGALVVPDTFEKEDADFQERVRDGYLQVALSKNIPIVSASGTEEEVGEGVWQQISEKLL